GRGACARRRLRRSLSAIRSAACEPVLDGHPYAASDTQLSCRVPLGGWTRVPGRTRRRLAPLPLKRRVWRHHAAGGRTVHARPGRLHPAVCARTRLSVLPLCCRRAFLHRTGADRPLLPGARPLVPRIGCDRLDRLAALHLCGCSVGARQQADVAATASRLTSALSYRAA